MVDLSVNLRGLKLANPTMTCSGTCGYAFEYADFVDLSKLGAFVTKSITREERRGNEPARIVEVRAGMLNAIGLQNIGIEDLVKKKAPLWARWKVPVVVNIAGNSVEDYAALAARHHAQIGRRLFQSCQMTMIATGTPMRTPAICSHCGTAEKRKRKRLPAAAVVWPAVCPLAPGLLATIT